MVANAVEAYSAANADEFMVSDGGSVPVDRFLETLDTFWDRVAVHSR